jgi:hypothetical protein
MALPRNAGTYDFHNSRLELLAPITRGLVPVPQLFAVPGIVYPTTVSGYMDGTGISIAPDAANVTRTIGLDSEVIWNISRNTGGTITVTLMRSSFHNGLLSRAVNMIRRGIPVAFPINFIDADSLGTTHSCAIAMPQGMATDERSAQANGYTWIFECGDLKSNIEGSIF